MVGIIADKADISVSVTPEEGIETISELIEQIFSSFTIENLLIDITYVFFPYIEYIPKEVCFPDP